MKTIGRNNPCPCGSGRKFKHCCLHRSASVSNGAPSLQLAIAHHQAGRLEEAETIYRSILALTPEQPDALHLLGMIAHRSGRYGLAVELIQKSIDLVPSSAVAYNNLGTVFLDSGRFSEAATCFRRAIALKSDHAEAYSNLGLALEGAGQLVEAIDSYRAAVGYQPSLAQVHLNLARALEKQGVIDAAIDAYRTCLAVLPGNVAALEGMGFLLRCHGRSGEAITAYRQALALVPEKAEAHFGLANALQEMEQYDEAATHYRRAIELEPGSAESYVGLGGVLQRQGRIEESIESYRQAIDRNADCAEAYSSLVLPLQQQGRIEEAVVCCHRAIDIKPEFPEAHSNLLFTLQYTCSTAEERFFEHLRYAERFEAPYKASWSAHDNVPDPSRKLRIGYVSGDFRYHAVAYFIEPIFGSHDRLNFETFCYHSYPKQDTVSERIATLVDHWIPCWDLTDEELARRIRSDRIDILIDLSGHTAYNRLPAFARKPAPIQMTWIGYPATTGLTAMDYRITEESLDPLGMTEQYHTESLLRLPAGAAFQPSPRSPPVNALPALASPEFTLACLNAISKINPKVIRLWSRILQALPQARLVLGNVTEPATRKRLLEMFAGEGIGEERLVILPRMPIGDYLEMHLEIDLALDPFPYTGGTTSFHSAWMGVPMITLAGDDARSRCGVALMEGLGLDEFVVESEDEYEARVRRFSMNLPELDRIRQSLRDRMATHLNRSPRVLTRHLEEAFRAAWIKWCDGLTSSVEPRW